MFSPLLELLTPSGFSHLLPEINLLGLFLNVLTVNKQWLLQPWHVIFLTECSNSFNSSLEIVEVFSIFNDLA